VEAWSRDGHIAYLLEHDNIQDIYAKPVTGEGKEFPVVTGPFRKNEPQFSFDGKWLAYAAETGGTFQVWVTSFPKMDQFKQVSKDGGGQPRWRQDGKELYYRDPASGQIMAVPIAIKADGTMDPGTPVALGVGPMATGPAARDATRHMLAVSTDGNRFLLRVPPGARGNPFIAQSGVPQIVPITQDTLNNRGARGGRGFRGGAANGLTVVWHWTSKLGKAAQ
jgi:hypothetical protein